MSKIREKERKLKERKSKKNIKLQGTATSLISIILILLTILFFAPSIDKYFINEPNKADAINTFLFTIFSTLFTVGAISIFYDFFDMVKYTKDQLREVVIEDDYIALLNRDKKESLKNRLEKELLFKGAAPDENCLYNFANDSIRTLIDSSYFDEYVVDIRLEIKNGIIIKHTTNRVIFNRLKLNNEPEEIDIAKLTRRWFRPLDGVENKDLCEITSFVVDDQDMSALIKPIVKNNPKSHDDYTVAWNAEWKDKKNKIYLTDKPIKIEIESTTKVEDIDKILTLRLRSACKRFDFSLNYDSNECEIFLEAFGFMYYKPCIKTSKAVDTMCNATVHIPEWMLPGDGVNVTILKK